MPQKGYERDRKRTAYYPITIGLHLSPKGPITIRKYENFLKQPWANPARWDKTDQESFWAKLLDCVENIAKSLGPPPPPQFANTVISVNAKIKIVAGEEYSVSTRAATDKMLRTFTKTGQVLQCNFDTNPIAVTVKQLHWSNLSAEHFERLIFNILEAIS